MPRPGWSISGSIHATVTDRLTEAYARHLPRWTVPNYGAALRVTVEIGFAVDVMLQEGRRVFADVTRRDTARIRFRPISRDNRRLA